MKGIIFIFSFFAFHTTFSQTVTLRDTTNQYDYIIITVPEFVSACEPFKQHKETVRGFNTLIVDTTQIFAEFDSSSTPQDNIRDFISYAGTFWREPRPQNYLLVGNLSKIPNYRSILFGGTQYADTAFTDFKYSVSKYNQDTTFSSFSIGRLPAKDFIELENYFNKVITFETDTIHSTWMNRNLFVSQYYVGDTVWTSFEQLTLSIMSQVPTYFENIWFTENDSVGNFGDRDSIINHLNNNGVSSLWFIGHTFNTQFGYNDIFNNSDVDFLNNNPMNFLTIFYLRQFFSSDTTEQGLADKLITDDNASIGIIAPTGTVFAAQQHILLLRLIQELYGISHNSLGETIRIVRNQIPYARTASILNLWGDPSLKLKYDVTVDVEDFQEDMPADFTLHQNYPNPFNPSTKIKFTIPQSPLLGEDGRGGLVTLKVYDVLGKEIATLVNDEKPAGNYEVEFNAANLPSGVYFYQLRAGLFIQTKKMILVK